MAISIGADYIEELRAAGDASQAWLARLKPPQILLQQILARMVLQLAEVVHKQNGCKIFVMP